MRIARSKLPIIVCILVLSAGAVWLWRSNRSRAAARASAQLSDRELNKLVDRFLALESREKEVAQTIWGKEMLAQKCAQPIERLWDELNAASNKFAILGAFPFREITLPKWSPEELLPHGIRWRRPVGVGETVPAASWRQQLAALQADGWNMDQAEFRHTQFELERSGRPFRSRFYLSAHLTNRLRPERAALEGSLWVHWNGDWNAAAQNESPAPRIDATDLTLKSRSGDLPFRQVLYEEIVPPDRSFFIDPLILHDLDGDGRSEIILAAVNRVYKLTREGAFAAHPLCDQDPGLIFTALLADFTGDGLPDFLCAVFEGLYLYPRSAGGRFDQPRRQVWTATPHLKYGQVLTAGDIDGDGDLDIWLGQYKVPYQRGQMPVPFYNANDGHPAYLLVNDGRGQFTDRTVPSGLGAKRWRRTYSGSLVDADQDGDLDLIVVSDFAGAEFYANDGTGRFTDVTSLRLPQPIAFGMSHLFADFNLDARLDFLMIGMNVPTVDRLESLGLARPGFADYTKMRKAMADGNRLFLGTTGGIFEPASLNDSIARSGWSWGCSAFDFDNDCYPDVYIGNGHETRQSVREYEPEFWLHDLYVATAKEDPMIQAYFDAKYARTRGQGHSYGGYELNRLFWNQSGRRFLEIGHLMGVALQQDSRNVATDDLDADGRVDLLVTTFEAWPQIKQTLRVYRNETPTTAHWTGLRFLEEGGNASPIGAQVTLQAGAMATTRHLLTGDSYRTQHATTLHFGLGNLTEIDKIEIRWDKNRSMTLTNPAVNIYHSIRLSSAPPRLSPIRP